MSRLRGASSGGGGGGSGNANANAAITNQWDGGGGGGRGDGIGGGGGGRGDGIGGGGGGGGDGIAARIRGVNAGIMDEQVLALVFRALNWDPQALCVVARVSRRLRAVAERVLWRELCVSRAPRMVSALTGGRGASPAASASASASGRIGGGWPALAKLLFFCCGAAGAGAAVPGHFAPVSRFSKTSGRSFLSRRCCGDLLYVSDPCEHAVAGAADDVGAYRGVFCGFMRSRTRACLVDHRAPLEPRVRCPYCGARVWSMTAAGLAPRSACRRLGTNEGRFEYFVCVSGHLHGSCWLARLSSSEGERGADDSDDSDSDSDDSDSDSDGGSDEDAAHVEL